MKPSERIAVLEYRLEQVEAELAMAADAIEMLVAQIETMMGVTAPPQPADAYGPN